MSDDLNDKRRKAQLAMESPKHKAAREAKEQAIKAEADTKRKLAEDLQKDREAAQAAEIARREEAMKTETKVWQERQSRLGKIAAAKSTIEEISKSDKSDLSPIRTFKGDLASVARSGNLSVENIIIKEKERGREEAAPTRHFSLAAINWRLVGLAGGILLILAIIGGGVYVVWPSGNTPAAPILPVTSLIIPSERREINVTDLSPEKLAAALMAQHQLVPVSTESITQLYFTTGKGTAKQLVPFTALANLAELDLPLNFTQSLGKDFMLGTFKSQTPAAFYLFNTTQPDALRAAMLGNERQVIEQLFNPLIGPGVNAIVETAQVRDGILNNTDVRIFTGLRGQTVFVYGLIANNLLIITENEATFSKIFNAYRP